MHGLQIAVALVVALAEDSANAIVAVISDVGPQFVPVGIGLDVMGEIDDVVPDVQVARSDFFPFHERLVGDLVLRVAGERVAVAGVNGRQADQHVAGRGDGAGRRGFFGVLVGQRLHPDFPIRQSGLHGGGHSVHKIQQRPGRGAEPGIGGAAGLALAIAVFRVVGGKAQGQFLGIGSGFRHQGVHHRLENARIAEAKLGIRRTFSFAVHQAVVIGMSGEIAVGRDKAVEIFRPVEEAVVAAQIRLVGHAHAIELEVRVPLGVCGNDGLVRVAIAEGRRLSFIQIGNIHDVLGRQDGGVRRVPARAHMVFEKGIDGVERAPVVVAGQEDVAPVCADHEGFLCQGGERRILEGGGEKRTGAHEDRRAGRLTAQDRQRGAGNLFQVVRQFLRRMFDRRAGIRGDDDGVPAPAMIGQNQSRLGGGGPGQEETNTRQEQGHERDAGDRNLKLETFG